MVKGKLLLKILAGIQDLTKGESMSVLLKTKSIEVIVPFHIFLLENIFVVARRSSNNLPKSLSNSQRPKSGKSAVFETETDQDNYRSESMRLHLNNS